MSPLRRALLGAFWVMMGWAHSAYCALPAAPQLSVDSEVANAGVYNIAWQDTVSNSLEYELEEAATADFKAPRQVYKGPDRARTFSGRPNGNYFYRVRSSSPQSAWSPALQVQVAHHPLSRAWTFFAMGALVFIATLGLILSGPNRDITP